MESEKYFKSGKYHFSALEIAAMKDEIVDNTNRKTEINRQIDDHKAHIKDLKAKVGSIDAENKEMSMQIENGYDIRMLQCTRVKDWDQGVFIYFDTFENEVCREPFTREDWQMQVGENIPKNNMHIHSEEE